MYEKEARQSGISTLLWSQIKGLISLLGVAILSIWILGRNRKREVLGALPHHYITEAEHGFTVNEERF